MTTGIKTYTHVILSLKRNTKVVVGCVCFDGIR